MTAHISRESNWRRIAATSAPFLTIALAEMGIRTPLAAAHPVIALLLFLWIASDTLMLALIAKTAGKPEWRSVIGALAGASCIVWLGSPRVVREALAFNPALAAGMTIPVLCHVVWATVRARRALNLSETRRHDRWASAVSEFLPPAFVRLAVAELKVIHMALFRWGGPADVPDNARAFAYYKHLTPMCATLLILSAIEIAVYHLLVQHWNPTATLVMFILSDVGFVYLLGLIKSFRFRPVLLTPDCLHIRAGFLIDQQVPLDAITSVETGFSGEDVRAPATLNAALLAWPNILIRLDRPVQRKSLLKKRGPFDAIAVRLDDPEPFIRLMLWRLDQRPS